MSDGHGLDRIGALIIVLFVLLIIISILVENWVLSLIVIQFD